MAYLAVGEAYMAIFGKLLEVNEEAGTIKIELASGETRTFEVRTKDPAVFSRLQRNVGRYLVFHINNNVVRGVSSTLTLKVYGLSYDQFISVFPDAAKGRSIWDSLAQFDISVESLIDFFFVVLWVIILAVVFVYAMIVLPLVYLFASLFTLGETWRMRHKVTINIKTWNIPKLLEAIPKINCMGGYIRGLEGYVAVPNSNSIIGRTFRFMDLGRISLGLSILALIVAYIHKTISNPSEAFIDYLYANIIVVTPVLILLAMGFTAMIVAGLLHRTTKKKIC